MYPGMRNTRLYNFIRFGVPWSASMAFSFIYVSFGIAYCRIWWPPVVIMQTLYTMATLSILLAVIHLWQHTINIKDHAGCEFACCQEVKSLRVRNQDKLKAKRYV